MEIPNKETNTKKICVILDTPNSQNSIASKTHNIVTEKPKINRVITKTDRWTQFVQERGNKETTAVNTIFDPNNAGNSRKLAEGQVRRKISSYKSQDLEKGIFDEDRFVSFQDVMDLFTSANLRCYYCKEAVQVLYEHVREPKQWTLERLDNSRGHNRDNVVLACLSCNLRRRCMASEKYVKTKAMTTIVKLDS